MMARRDRTDMTPATAATLLVAWVLLILALIGCVSYLVLAAQPAAAAGAIVVPALPVRGPWWRRALRRWAVWRCRQDIDYLQYAINQWQLMLLSDSCAIDDLRDRLAAQQRRLLDLQSRP